MENAGQELRDELQKPKKKKFMTPERKKKLRQVFPIIHRPPHLVPHPNSSQLLMREAAKQLKIEQEKKEAERRKVLKIPNKNSHKHDHLAIMTTIFR